MCVLVCLCVWLFGFDVGIVGLLLCCVFVVVICVVGFVFYSVFVCLVVCLSDCLLVCWFLCLCGLLFV